MPVGLQVLRPNARRRRPSPRRVVFAVRSAIGRIARSTIWCRSRCGHRREIGSDPPNARAHKWPSVPVKDFPQAQKIPLPLLLSDHNPNKIGNVFRAGFAHDIGAVKFYSPRTYTEIETNFFA